MAVFFGHYDTTIDAKRRLAIPAAIREQIVPAEDGENIIVILGPEKRLWMYPDRYYRLLLGKMKKSALPSREMHKLGLMFSLGQVLKPDAQGRVVLSEETVKLAGVSGDVTLACTDDHVEVWAADAWKKHVEQNLANYGEMLYEAADRLNSQDSPQ